MKTNHSKLPWSADEFGNVIGTSPSGYKEIVAHLLFPDNAELIARSVNNFYPLLEACKEYRSLLFEQNFESTSDFKRLEQVIKNAEGGES